MVPGPPARVYEVLREVDFARSRVIRLLFAARGLGPAFRQGRRRIHASLAVFVRAGFLLLDERPGEDWIADADRRAAAGVPEQVGFATKPELANRMLARTLDTGVPATWGDRR